MTDAGLTVADIGGAEPWGEMPVSDLGGGALILVGAERARDFPQNLAAGNEQGPVSLLGTGESVETPMVSPPPLSAGVTKGTPRQAPSASPAPRHLPRPASRVTMSIT
jgi:hypothetical protein